MYKQINVMNGKIHFMKTLISFKYNKRHSINSIRILFLFFKEHVMVCYPTTKNLDKFRNVKKNLIYCDIIVKNRGT